MIKRVAKTSSSFAIFASLLLGLTPAVCHAWGKIASEEATVEFQKVLREIGLNDDQVRRVYETYLDVVKRDRALETAHWLKEQGIKDVPKFVTQKPDLLVYPVEKNLQPKVDWLRRQGVKDIGAFLSLSPPFLSLSLEENIKVKAGWLQKQGIKDVGKVIGLYPQFFQSSIEKTLQPKVDWLRMQGITDVAKVIHQAPAFFSQSKETLDDNVKWLVDNGVEDISKVITKAPSILTHTSAKSYEPMAKWLRAHGVENIGKVISDFPSIFGLSLANLDKKIEWLENHNVPKLGKVIENYPQLLGCSIQDNYEQIFPWLERQGIYDPGEMIRRYPQLFGLSIEENLDPKMAEYRDIWKMTTDELGKTPIYFGSSLSRVQELREFLNEIAKMSGAESFDFSRLTENQRRKLIQNLSSDIILGYLKDVKVIDPARKSLADLTSQERALLGRLYKTNELSRFFVWKNEFHKESKQAELGCLFGTIKRGLKIR